MTTEARTKTDFPVVMLGRDNHNLYTGLVNAEYDDITFRYVKSGTIPEVPPIKRRFNIYTYTSIHPP